MCTGLPGAAGAVGPGVVLGSSGGGGGGAGAGTAPSYGNTGKSRKGGGGGGRDGSGGKGQGKRGGNKMTVWRPSDTQARVDESGDYVHPVIPIVRTDDSGAETTQSAWGSSV